MKIYHIYIDSWEPSLHFSLRIKRFDQRSMRLACDDEEDPRKGWGVDASSLISPWSYEAPWSRAQTASCARAKQGRRECELTRFSSATLTTSSFFSAPPSSSSSSPSSTSNHLPRRGRANKMLHSARSHREEPSLHLHGLLLEAAREDIALMNLSRESRMEEKRGPRW